MGLHPDACKATISTGKMHKWRRVYYLQQQAKSMAVIFKAMLSLNKDGMVISFSAAAHIRVSPL